MDPIEEHDILKFLKILEDERVGEKILSLGFALDVAHSFPHVHEWLDNLHCKKCDTVKMKLETQRRKN